MINKELIMYIFYNKKDWKGIYKEINIVSCHTCKYRNCCHPAKQAYNCKDYVKNDNKGIK